jgi:hypothetical protein
MPSQKIRLIVSTNSNIRFITVLPVDITIEKSLPILCNRYRAVLAENLTKDHILPKGKSILQLTKKGCLIARDEFIGDVFVNDDEIKINIEYDEEG